MHPPPAYDTPPNYSEPMDKLPSYKPSLEFYGMTLMKTEFVTPFHYNTKSRAWKPVFLELNSTQLNIYALNIDKQAQDLIVSLYTELNSLHALAKQVNDTHRSSESGGYDDLMNSDFDLFSGDAYGGDNDAGLAQFSTTRFGKLKSNVKKYKNTKHLAEMGKYYDLMKNNQMLFEPVISAEQAQLFAKTYRGGLINSFTLSYLQIGEAPSLNQLISALYKEESHSYNVSSLAKYKNVLRLRIEYKQVLLQFWSFYGAIHWFRMLSMGRDLALPLETRAVTRLKSIPTNNSRRNNALLAATAAAAAYADCGSSPGRRINSDAGELFDVIPAFDMADPFGPLSTAKLMAPDSSSSLTYSCQSRAESIFERRESIFTSSTASSDSDLDAGKYTTTINNYKFYSYDNYYNTLEKQFISNCIPELNSFDKWNNKVVTLSNYEWFVPRDKHTTEDDLYIGYTSFAGTVASYDKNTGRGRVDGRVGNCRNFLIHSSGIVSVAFKVE